MNGWALKKLTNSFGPIERFGLAADLISTPNTSDSQDIYSAANGLVVHQPYTTIRFAFITTVAGTNVSSGTLTGNPGYKFIIYNATSVTVYINFNAAATLPSAGLTAGSFPLLTTSYFTEEIVANNVQIIIAGGAATGDVHITYYTA